VDSSVQLEAGITPLDQSEAPNDLETTRRIRQAVVQDDSLSFRAKNVMIVTKGGRVVLTGPVNTRAEADRIKGIAQSITPYRIEDRLEVRR
jgi:osmotically-inducible protein OsmY